MARTERLRRLRAELWMLEEAEEGLASEAIAEQLGVSTRTALRDLLALRASGYPLAWVGGCWRFVKGQPLPTSLAADDAGQVPERDRVLLIDRAIRRRLPLAASYWSATPGSARRVELAALELLHHEGSLFLVAREQVRGPLAAFAVERLGSLHILSGSVPRLSRKDLETYLAGAFRGDAAAQLVRVAVRFRPEMSWRVTERTWHPSQRVTLDADGAATATFRVPGFSWIRAWVLGFGADATALEPPELVRQICLELERAREQYRWAQVQLPQLDLFSPEK